MGREKVDYRDQLERLDAAFPRRELLQIKEVAEYLGVSPATVRRYIPATPGLAMINKVTLARWMCAA